MDNHSYRFGFYASVGVAAMTVITFAIAYLTPPLSGPYCQGGCFTYPYTDIISRFPRDYWWMYPAIMLNVVFVAFMASIHHNAPEGKRVYSQVGMSFALMAAAIFIVDYFVQVSVVQPSLLKGETEGVALLSQFNPHGIFIVLEEIGFLLMGLAFLCMAPVFGGGKLERSIRWMFIASFALNMLSLVLYSVSYGINREYRFEVATISINWLTLIVSGILLAILFNRLRKQPQTIV